MIKREDITALMTGLMATFAGLGIARFAYTPLMPELISQGWFQDSQAAYLGAAALLGYLAGRSVCSLAIRTLYESFVDGALFYQHCLEFYSLLTAGFV